MNRREGIAPALENGRELDVPPDLESELVEFDLWQQVEDFVGVLWSRRRFLLRFVAAGLILSTSLAFLLPKTWESTTQIMPPDQNSGAKALAVLASLGGPGGAAGALGADLLEMKSSGALFIGVLKSRTLSDRLLERYNLKQVYGTRIADAARLQLAEHTTITEDRKSGIITIRVLDRDRNRATALARAYVEELNRLIADLNTSAAHREREFIEQRLVVVKQELDASAKAFSQFSAKNGAIDIQEQGKAMVTAAAALQGRLIAAEAQLKGLEQIYTESNVRVRSLRQQVNELRRQLEKMGGTAGASPEPSSYPTIRELPVLGVTYFDLYRRTKVQEAVFEALTKQYELAKVQEAKETPTVRVLDVAEVPERKAGPPRLLIIMVGTIFAFAIGAVAIFSHRGWEAMDAAHPLKRMTQGAALEFRGAVRPYSERWHSGGLRARLRPKSDVTTGTNGGSTS